MTERIGAYSPENARMVLEVVNHLKRAGLVHEGTQPRKYNPPPNTPIYFRNDSGEEVPPYGCMQVTGMIPSNGQNFFTISKPVDEDATSGAYLFNQHSAVPVGAFGVSSPGVQVRAISGSLANGDRVSPTSGSWEVKQADTGLFICGGEDDIGTNVVRVFLYPQVVGGGSIIEFEILAVTSSSSSSSSSSSTTDTNECADKLNDAPTTVQAKITRRPCGVSSVPGEVGGEVTLIDSAAGGFLKERQSAELEGKAGFAAYMSDTDSGDENGSSTASSSSSSTATTSNCKWVIIWIDWFREVQVVHDIIFGTNEITVERKNVKVWDDCDLPDEVIEGTDCVETSSSSSTV